jgi:hypothetical protein
LSSQERLARRRSRFRALDATLRGGCDWAEQAEHGGLDNSNWKTPVLIYSSASGAYAGANLEGSKISTDDQTIRNLYGPNATLQTIFGGQSTSIGIGAVVLGSVNRDHGEAVRILDLRSSETWWS